MTTATSKSCKETGTYRCSLHPTCEITINEGDPFPTCKKNGGHRTKWLIIKKEVAVKK